VKATLYNDKAPEVFIREYGTDIAENMPVRQVVELRKYAQELKNDVASSELLKLEATVKKAVRRTKEQTQKRFRTSRI
jgi:hypothetical protein